MFAKSARIKSFACFPPSLYVCFQAGGWGVLSVAHLKYKGLFLIALCFTAAWLGVRSEGAQTPKNVLSLSDSVIWTPVREDSPGLFHRKCVIIWEVVPMDMISFRNREETESSWFQIIVQISSKSSCVGKAERNGSPRKYLLSIASFSYFWEGACIMPLLNGALHESM